jgi:predicted site-specific integrase-resolvase
LSNICKYGYFAHEIERVCQTTGISYSTALLWWKAGAIRGYQASSGTIIVEAKLQAQEERVVMYARLSSPEQRENLERQVERLLHYCTVQGYQVKQLIKEIGSGVNESRPKLQALLKDQQATRIVIEHKDRITRFGFRYLETL